MHYGSDLIRLPRVARWRKLDRKSTRLNSSHLGISYAVFCLKKKNRTNRRLSSQARAAAMVDFSSGNDRLSRRILRRRKDRQGLRTEVLIKGSTGGHGRADRN